MRRSLIVLFLSVSLTSTALAAKKEAQHRDCTKFPPDGSALAESDYNFYLSILKPLVVSEATAYALSWDTLIDDKELAKREPKLNQDLTELRELTKERVYADEIRHDALAEKKYLNEQLKRELSKDLVQTAFCAIESARKSEANSENRHISIYLSKLRSIKRATEADIGYFHTKVTSCEIKDKISTGNKYTELPPEDDSRYMIVSVSFKNIDTEGRLPFEGDLIIKANGKEYRFDAVETIFDNRYGVRFRSINPLITMKTKIVYRIPNELSGQSYWEPGRNKESTRLWCNYL